MNDNNEINGIEYDSIEQILDKGFYVVKFGKEENINKLQHGLVYMKELDYYRELKNRDNNKGVGDKLDGVSLLHNQVIKINGIDMPPATICYSTNIEKRSPIFCTTLLDSHVMKMKSKNSAKICFSNSKIADEFGECALVISLGHFLEKIRKYCIDNKIGYCAKKVKYCDYSNHNNYWLEEYRKDKYSHYFIKDKYFEYQNEYRIVLLKNRVGETNDNYQIKLDSLEECSTLFKARDFINGVIELKNN